MDEERFHDLFVALRGAYYALRGRMEDILEMGATRGLNMDDALVIYALLLHGDMTVEGLAGVLDRNASSVSRQLGSMLKRGLVEKHRRPEDRRVVDVRLTNSAQWQGAEVGAKCFRVYDRLVQGLSPIEQRELVRMLLIVAGNGFRLDGDRGERGA